MRCDFFAKYAHILEYWKIKDPAEVKADLDQWLNRNKKWLDGDRRTPRKVAVPYYQNIGFDINKPADKIYWDFFGGVEYDSSNE